MSLTRDMKFKNYAFILNDQIKPSIIVSENYFIFFFSFFPLLLLCFFFPKV